MKTTSYTNNEATDYNVEYAPIPKNGLSEYALGFLQNYCDLRNYDASICPHLFEDEQFKILTIENMSLSHIRTAIEMEALGCEVDMDVDERATSELYSFISQFKQ